MNPSRVSVRIKDVLPHFVHYINNPPPRFSSQLSLVLSLPVISPPISLPPFRLPSLPLSFPPLSICISTCLMMSCSRVPAMRQITRGRAVMCWLKPNAHLSEDARVLWEELIRSNSRARLAHSSRTLKTMMDSALSTCDFANLCNRTRSWARVCWV